ncbi:MAG TPA: homocitrate synthase [Alphaproteobacteria bacterium]|nr:homocitrate synthase [Alphaproteobacteria bacterium]
MPAPYAIVDTTLREGEQFEHCDFTLDDKIAIARALDGFGVEYIEVTSPAASERSLADCRTLVGLGLRSRIVAHVRCNERDIAAALDAGVGAISMVMGGSKVLREASHGLTIDGIIELAITVGRAARSLAPGAELRFSTEDAFRCAPDDLMRIYRALHRERLFDRFGLADTTGYATPDQVGAVVGRLRAETASPIEFHGHNDIGCAVANAHAALRAGATHINTTVLGIGERNGITALEGLIACLYAHDPETTRQKYRLPRLAELSGLVAARSGAAIPFNHPIVGATAFSHKAGVHTKAVLNDPRAYEVIDPETFGKQRRIVIAHRLTGWNALRNRAETLGLGLTDEQARRATAMVKAEADRGPITDDDVDAILRAAAAMPAGATRALC